MHRHREKRCAECRRRFSHGSQYWRELAGLVLCRDRALCLARQAAARRGEKAQAAGAA